MTTVAIPAWNHLGLLPPVEANFPLSPTLATVAMNRHAEDRRYPDCIGASKPSHPLYEAWIPAIPAGMTSVLFIPKPWLD